jgi:hypothetical protein
VLGLGFDKLLSDVDGALEPGIYICPGVSCCEVSAGLVCSGSGAEPAAGPDCIICAWAGQAMTIVTIAAIKVHLMKYLLRLMADDWNCSSIGPSRRGVYDASG